MYKYTAMTSFRRIRYFLRNSILLESMVIREAGRLQRALQSIINRIAKESNFYRIIVRHYFKLNGIFDCFSVSSVSDYFFMDLLRKNHRSFSL